MSATVKFTRREFLRHTGAGTGALVIGASISFPQQAAAGLLSTAKEVLHNGFTLNPFVTMHLDGTIVIQAHRSEMGQGIKSSLAAVLADELDADWSRVQVVQADADGPRYAIANSNPGGKPSLLISDEASQFADSSRSMCIYFLPMRLFGAGIRLVFVRAAARSFGVDPAECRTENHHVLGPRGQKIAYGGHLLPYALQVPVPTIPEIMAVLKKPEQWKFITKDMPFVDAHDMVTGKAVYGADVELPGMLTAMIERCPVANGEVKSFDDSETRQVPGVVDVIKVRLPGGWPAGGVGGGFAPHAGVAVLAENTWAAWQGRRKLKVDWDYESSPAGLLKNADYDSAAYRGELEASTARPGKTLREKGHVDDAFSAAAQVVEHDYYVPHLAQAPMEPPAAVAIYDNGHFEVWSPTQGPEITQHYIGAFLLDDAPNPLEWLAWQTVDPCEIVKECEREEVAAFNKALGAELGLDDKGLFARRDELKKRVREKVKVHVTLLGGGFGRKSQPDYAIEAAYLAKHRPGVPIKVQWTREDDIKFSYFHAVSNQRLKAALDGDGTTTAWLQRSAFPSFFGTLFPAAPEIFQKARAGYFGGGEYPYGAAIERAQGLEDLPFAVKNLRVENCPAHNHIRLGWMRSVSNIFHAFAIGSFVNELAIAAGRDGKDYLLELIGKGSILDLQAEAVRCFDNNGLPPLNFGGLPPVIAPYPPDTRRLRGVVEKVAERSGWDEKRARLPQGHGLGIAAHRSFLSYAAIVVHVSLDEANKLTVHEIYCALDCGFAVNPDRVKAQMEGGVLYGLSYALLGEITARKGAVVQNNFDDYPVLRIHQAPKTIDVFTVEPSPDVVKDCANGEVLPTGVGEPPTPAVAPALANAIVAAGGPRIRAIPFAWRKGDPPGTKVVVV